MTAVNSTMLAIGTPAPAFSLVDTRSGDSLSLDNLAHTKGLCVMFICNHCPYVKNMLEALMQAGKQLQNSGIDVVAISSNDPDHYPEDAPQLMKALAQKYSMSFPYLFDEDQSVAKAYKAACTPDFFLFDSDLKLAYRGQFDDSRPGNDVEPSGQDLLKAAELMLDGQSIPESDQKPSIGCNIKWKPDCEPDYFRK